MSKESTNTTPLLELLRKCTPEERTWLARTCGTTVGYLYLLSTCQRKNPGVSLALSIEDASKTLRRKTRSRTPLVTVRDLAHMAALQGFNDVADLFAA